ncbi:hypothetical protein BH24ACT2_BH24ACT2_17980 [soil metagenome]
MTPPARAETLDVVTPPQRFLSLVGAILVASGVFHFGVFLVDGGPWGGPLSWRKPVTFGISFGVTALAVAWIAGFLDLRRQAGWLLLGSLGVASALEVAWVTLQAWRGVPSHFAREGVDEALFIAAGISIAVVGVALVVVTVLAFRKLVAPPSMALAIRVGLILLLVGQGLGGAIIANGTVIDRPPLEVDLAVFGSAGAMKVPHAAALHAVQVLPVLAWLLARTQSSERRRTQVVAIGALGYGALVAASTVQTFSGRGPLDLSLLGALLAVAGVSVLAASFAVALVTRSEPFPGNVLK